jgi:hypothetical protein
MKIHTEKKPAVGSKPDVQTRMFLVWFFLMVFFPVFLAAEDRRSFPLTVYLIFDGSGSIKNGKDAAISWISGYIIDEILQDGDNLTILVAGTRPEAIFSESLQGTAQKETVRELLRSVRTEGSFADYAGALREAAAREDRRAGDGVSYTLLVTGAAGDSFRHNTLGEFLRYSRVQDFSGWRVQVVGLGLGSRIRKAVSGYMAGG